MINLLKNMLLKCVLRYARVHGGRKWKVAIYNAGVF